RAARGQGAAGRGGDSVVIIAGNWKMYLGPDPEALAAALPDGVDAIVCPPFTGLAECVAAGLTTYAQNVHWEPEGPYTGEISTPTASSRYAWRPRVSARSSRHPRRLGMRAAGARQRRRACGHSGLRPPLARLPAHAAQGVGRSGRPAARADGQLGGGPPHDRL